MMRLVSAMVLVTALVGMGVVLGCGGGGGGPGVPFGGVTTSDVGGSWLGPTGTATPGGMLTGPATPGGLMVDGQGNASGTQGLTGLSGRIALSWTVSGSFAFEGTGASTGRDGILLLHPDTKNHCLLILNDGTFAALQRNATMLAAPYMDAEFRMAAWGGYSVGMGAQSQPIEDELTSVMIDAGGSFTAGTSSTNATPLAVSDANTGEIHGDFMDPGPPPENGTLLLLLTPDRQFLAVISCPTGAGSFQDCGYSALAR